MARAIKESTNLMSGGVSSSTSSRLKAWFKLSSNTFSGEMVMP